MFLARKKYLARLQFFKEHVSSYVVSNQLTFLEEVNSFVSFAFFFGQNFYIE